MIEITADLYAWLASLNILESESKDFRNAPVTNFHINEVGNVILEEKIQKRMRTGVFFTKLFQNFNFLLNEIFGNIYKDDERMSNLIEEDTPQIKLKNFEIILDVAKNYYGILADNNIKTLLVAGDNESFLELFNQLKAVYTELEKKLQNVKNDGEKSEKKNKESDIDAKIVTGFIPKMRLQEDHVDIEELDMTKASKKPLSQTKSVLEFIIIVLCRAFTMTARQAAALLADNKKYLTHLIIKGMGKNNAKLDSKALNALNNSSSIISNKPYANSFSPIKQFFQEILSNIDHFMQLIEINSIVHPNQISKNIEMSLSTFKLGLLSKNVEVVYIAGRVLTKLAFEFIERNLISSAWDWFVMPSGGLEACILCLRKHNSAVEVVVSLFTNFGRFHLYELFTLYLKNFLQNEGAYFDFLSDVIEKFSHLKFFVDEFIKNKIKEFFLEYAIECSNSYNINCKIQSVIFLSELWINFSIYFEEDEENFMILNTLKKLSRDDHRLVQYTAVTQLFRILGIFAKERNSFAPTIYKTLTFFLIEYNQDIRVKEYVIANFSNMFKVIMSIPVGILVEPYIKQLNVALGDSNFFNMVDMEFFITLTKHPRLNIKDAILILDTLGKVYFQIESGIYLSSLLRNVFTMILSRYMMNEVGVEFCFKYCKMLIEMFCRLDKKLSDKIYLNSVILNLNPVNNLKEILLYDNPSDYKRESEGGTSDPKQLIEMSRKESNFEIFNQKTYSQKPTFNVAEFTKSCIISMLISIIEINNVFINNVLKSLLISADLRHFFIYRFHNIGICRALDYFGNSHDIVHYYNVNNEELDVDKDFETAMESIYDKPPVDRKNLEAVPGTKLGAVADSIKKEKPPANFFENKKLREKKIPPVMKKTNKLIKYILDNKNNFEKQDAIISNQALSIGNLNYNHIFLDLAQEEDRDIIELKKLLKDYNRFFRYMYNKYSGSIYHPIYGKLFSSVKEVGNTIAPSEIVKMFKDHQICSNNINVVNAEINVNRKVKKTSLIKKDEILFVTGMMSSKIFKKNSKSGFNFDEFTEVFLQIAYFCFNRPPYFYRNFSAADYLVQMIKLFRRNLKKSNLLSNDNNSLDTHLAEYMHPDDLMTKAETILCEEINRKLITNNSTKIPEGFRKYLDTQMKDLYAVPDCMRVVLSESQKICIEIVDEIIFNTFKVHTLEPSSFVRERYKVRPVKLNSTLIKLKEEREKEEKRILRIKRNYSSVTTDYPDGVITENTTGYMTGNSTRNLLDRKDYPLALNNRPNATEIENKKIFESDVEERSNTSLKQLLSNKKIIQNKTLHEVNQVVNDLKVSNSMEDTTSPRNEKIWDNQENSSIEPDTNKQQESNSKLNTNKEPYNTSTLAKNKRVLNHVHLRKIAEEENKILEDLKKEKKRRLRDQFVKEELDKLKEEKRMREERRNKLLEEEKKKNEERSKNQLLSRQKVREKLKLELEKIKQTQIEEKRKKEEKEKKLKLNKNTNKTNYKKSFDLREYSKVKEELKKISDEKKLQLARKRLEDKFKEDKVEVERKKFSKILEIERLTKDEKKKIFIEIDKMREISTIKDKFLKFEDHIKLLYEIYTNKNQGIVLSEFQNFCNQFYITNVLIENQEISFIFKKIANKFKTNNYLDYEGFALSLLYISIFSLEKFKNLDKQVKEVSNINEINQIKETSNSNDFETNPHENENENDSNLNYSLQFLKTGRVKIYEKLNKQSLSLIDDQYIENFFNFKNLKLPYNRNNIINQINFNKNISAKEKNKILKEKEKLLEDKKIVERKGNLNVNSNVNIS